MSFFFANPLQPHLDAAKQELAKAQEQLAQERCARRTEVQRVLKLLEAEKEKSAIAIAAEKRKLTRVQKKFGEMLGLRKEAQQKAERAVKERDDWMSAHETASKELKQAKDDNIKLREQAAKNSKLVTKYLGEVAALKKENKTLNNRMDGVLAMAGERMAQAFANVVNQNGKRMRLAERVD